MKLLKTSFAAIGILCLAISAHAQSLVPYLDGLKNAPKQPTLPVKKKTVNKSTATMSRLIASSFRDHYQSPTFVLNDSMRFFFSGMNTSDHNTYPKSCDSFRRLQFGTNYYPGPDTQAKVVQVLDNDGHILVSYDMTCNSNFMTLDTLGISAYVYDNNGNKIEEYTISQATDTLSRNLYTYDNNDNLLTSTTQVYVQGTWVNGGDRYIYSYNNGNCDTIRTQTWNNGWQNAGVVTYLYNTNDSATFYGEHIWDVATNDYIPFSRYNISYSNEGCPILGILEHYANQAWSVSAKRSSSYFPGTCNFHTDSNFSWDNTLNGLLFDAFNRFENYMAPAKPTEWYQYLFTTPGVPEQAALVALTYNAYDQLTMEYGLRWDNVTNSTYVNDYCFLHHHYYEEYEGLDTKPINTAAVDAVFYPVPATDELNIQLNWYEPQSFTITISDISGKAIKSFSEKVRKEYKGTLNLADLSAGNYLIILSGTKERIVRKFSISQ